ncbi:MAG: AMP-binding protein [bacterium]
MLRGISHQIDPTTERAEWRTLIDMLRSVAWTKPEKGLFLSDARGGQEFRTYAQITETALRVGAALQLQGVQRHDRVLLAMNSGFEFLEAFFGAIAIGATPVPIAPPVENANSRTNQAEFFVRFSGRMNASAAVFDSGAAESVRPPKYGPLKLVSDVPKLLESTPMGAGPDIRGGLPEIAWIQTTSGASATRGAVRVSHNNVLSSLEAVGLALEVTDADFGVSWLPMYNAMGLVGGLLFNLYWGLDMALLSPERFMARPEEWLLAISRHKATLSVAPSYSYYYAARRTQNSHINALDLSAWRAAMTGGDPVHRLHIETFVKRFEPCGARSEMFMPVYGMAEATLGITFGKLNQPTRYDIISRPVIEQKGIAEPVSPSIKLNERAEVCCVGTPLANVEVRIVDSSGNEAPDRKVGEILVRGPNVMLGYDDNPVSRLGTHQTRLDGEWLRTADLGYIANGELFVLGRSAGVLVTADGRKITPDELELVSATVDGVHASAVVAFDTPQGIVVAFEAQEGADTEELLASLDRRTRQYCGIVPTFVRVSTRSIPKSASGKVRRHIARELFLNGKLDRRDREKDFLGFSRIITRSRHEALKLGKNVTERLGSLLKRNPD